MKPTNPLSTRRYRLKDVKDLIVAQVNREDQTTISYFLPPSVSPRKMERELTPMAQHSFFSNIMKFAWSFAP